MDVTRVLHSLTDARVDFVLVGGMAVIAHGVVHATNDIDLCYAADSANVDRLVQALGPLNPRLRVEGLTDEQSRALPFQWDKRTILGHELLTLRTDGGALDLIRTIPGVGDYAAVYAAPVPVRVFAMIVRTLDLPALIESKRAVRRPKDLAVLPQMEATLRMRDIRGHDSEE